CPQWTSAVTLVRVEVELVPRLRAGMRIVRGGTEEGVTPLERRIREHGAQQLLHGSLVAGVDENDFAARADRHSAAHQVVLQRGSGTRDVRRVDLAGRLPEVGQLRE